MYNKTVDATTPTLEVQITPLTHHCYSDVIAGPTGASHPAAGSVQVANIDPPACHPAIPPNLGAKCALILIY